MKQAASSDGGFSILEVLIALALSALVVMGIGGLLTLSIRVRSGIDEGSRVQTALIDIQSILQLTGEARGLAVAEAEDEGFALVVPKVGAGGSPELSRRLSLDTAAQAKALELLRGDRETLADLSVFASIALEYLQADPDPVWQSAGHLGNAPAIGVRLRLTLGDRVWRPLLWMVSPYDLSQPGVSRALS